MIVGITSGCFDLVHFGHVVYLERCKTQCDKLIVGVDSDKMVKKAKGPTRPIIPELERLALINSLSSVNSAFMVNNLKDLHEMSVRFCANKVFKHERFKHLNDVVGVTNTNAELIIVPDIVELTSTSEIISKIMSNNKEI